MHAGFGDPPIDSRKYRAQKLAKRADDFATSHGERLGDLRGEVADWAGRLCKARDAADPEAIRVATVELGKNTAKAVKKVYPNADATTPLRTNPW